MSLIITYRKELDILKKALKEDYIANEKEMPVNVTKPIKGEKRPKPIKQVLAKKVVEIIEVHYTYHCNTYNTYV